MAEFTNDNLSNTETKVDIVGISSNALQGLYQALKEQANLIADLTKGIANVGNGINDAANEQDKANKSIEKAYERAEAAARERFLSGQNRDIANNRRSRAASAAVYDKVDKVLSATDILKNTLKDIGSKIVGMLSNMAKDTLKSYDDAVRSMRKLDLTTTQIKENTLKADKAKLYLSEMGYKVNSGISKSVMTELVSLGEDTSTFTKEQIASLTMAKRQGLDIRSMIDVVRSTKDQDKLIKVIANMSDPASKEAMIKLSSQIGEGWFKLYAQNAKGGDASAALEELSNYVKNIDSVLPGLNAESKKSMAEMYAKMSTGQFESLKANFNNLIPTGAWKDPSKFAESIENYIKSTDKSSDDKMNELRVLLNAAEKGENGLDPKFIESLMSAVQAEQAGNYKKKTIRTEEENKEAINQNQPGGKVGGAVNTVLTKLNVLTGGVFSKMSAGLNEMFGDQGDMSSIVSKGFTVVCSLLASIVASKIIGSPLSLLTKVVGAGLLIKLKDLFKGKGKGDGSGDEEAGDSKPKPEDIVNPKPKPEDKPKPKPEDIVNPKPKPEDKPKPAPRDIDSEYKEAIKKIKEDASKAWDGIRDGASKAWKGIKSIPSGIAKTAGKAWKGITETSSKAWKGIKSVSSKAWDGIRDGASKAWKGIKSIPGIAKQALTNMAKRSVIAISKVPDAFSAVKNRAKDAFSSFKTSMKSAFKSMKESAKSAFKKLPGALKGSAGKIGKGALAGIGMASGVLGLLGATGAFDSLTPILEDFSKTIAPVLSDAVKTLAPTIQMLLQSLAPVLQNIITALAPILDGVLKAITPIIISLVNSLVPVLDSLFKTLTPILNTVTNTLTPIIDMLVQTVMPVITTILDVLTPIIETVLDVLTPILTSVFKVLAPVIKIIAKVTTPILKLIGNLLKGVGPIIEMVLKPVSFALNLITKPLKLIADLMSDNASKNADTSNAASDLAVKFEKQGKKEYANMARQLQIDAANDDVVEREDDESDEAYVARAYKKLHGNSQVRDLNKESIFEESLRLLREGVDAQDNSTFGWGDNFAGRDIEYWRDLPIESVVEEIAPFVGINNKKLGDFTESDRRKLKIVVDALNPNYKTWPKSDYKKINLLASGGVINKATPAIVGEAGKEVVLPLTKPDRIVELLKQLTSNEKLLLIRSLLKEKSLTKALSSVLHLNDNINGTRATTNAIDLATKNTAEQNKKKLEDIELAEGSVIAENMIIGASKQTGKKYAEMVCNQLVEAAMKWAGFTPPTTGPVFKHFNHPNMHLVLNDPEKGINPNDPKLKPGMIMFSHPLTQAEADELNRTKGKGRKSGDPGHMGIYAGNGLWWNSTSSKNTTDYSSGKGVKVTDNNKGFGVALTKPFTTGTYKLYAAGYYDGMFDAASVKGLQETSHKELKDDSNNSTENTSTNINPAYSSVKNAGLFTDEELSNIAVQAGVNNSQTMSEFIKQAGIALNGNSSNREDIIAILIEIARYLKGAVQSKQPMMSVARPPAKVYS